MKTTMKISGIPMKKIPKLEYSNISFILQLSLEADLLLRT